MNKSYDKIIIGAGIYGLYSALHCGLKGESVVVLEMDDKAFGRATYINQARVHNGYHYPRSLSTAQKSASYFSRFNSDFSFCINSSFSQVYATSNDYSWSSGDQFKAFCNAVDIPCEELNPNRFFKEGLCDAAFLTKEFTYDKSAIAMTALMILVTVIMLVYSIVIYAMGIAIEGWTTTILFLSVAFFGLFAVLTVVIKYLQLIIDLVFKRKHYSYESIEKLTK